MNQCVHLFGEPVHQLRRLLGLHHLERAWRDELAVGAMALSLICQMTGRGKWGNFIAQWVPTWLIIGVYNKLVKLEGHDQTDRGETAEQLGEYICEFCDSKFSLEDDLESHQKHCRLRPPAAVAVG